MRPGPLEKGISEGEKHNVKIAADPDEHIGEVEARNLLKRTPTSYLLNQVYGLWFFVSLFFFTLLITYKVSTQQYGILSVALTAYNTILYITALGLEDALTTYLPRILAEHGRASAAYLVRMLLFLRLATLLAATVMLIFGLTVLAYFIALLPGSGPAAMAVSLRDPALLGHIIPIAIYVVGSSLGSLFTAVCAAQMRMRIVFVVGSLTQLILLGAGFLVLQLGFNIDGVLWLEAILSLLNAGAFALWQAPLVFTRGATYKQPLRPVIKLGISAWLTNLATGALLKQVSIILLTVFTVSFVQIGYFNLAFQLADAANMLLVTGFGGISNSALAASFVGQNYERLARSWQALVKIETLLAAPALIFCLFNAQNIVDILYKSKYDAVGPLMAIFLFFNIIVRVLGTTIHQPTLYVVGKPRLVVLGQWLGLLTVVIVGIILVPRFGAAGALISDGIARVVTGVLLLVFLWRELPRKYPLGFTLRLLLALTIAALPGLLWHPTNRVLLGISGAIFLVLCVALLRWIRPLSTEDLQMSEGLNPRVRKYLAWFAHEPGKSRRFYYTSRHPKA
jgi:O-antigen/teichoic acid export membrane protein